MASRANKKIEPNREKQVILNSIGQSVYDHYFGGRYKIIGYGHINQLDSLDIVFVNVDYEIEETCAERHEMVKKNSRIFLKEYDNRQFCWTSIKTCSTIDGKSIYKINVFR